jgi:hypothetical protein
MPSLRRSLLDPSGTYGLRSLGASLRAPAMYPAADDAEYESAAQSLIGTGLSGLGYVGSILDKYGGGRAIRGLLGGKPRELLSLLPFSDTLGITDFADRVSGEDILTGKGLLPQLIAENDPERFQARDLAGPLFEMATDPLSYLTPFARTAEGLAALKANTAVSGISRGVRAGERALLGVGLPFRHPSIYLGDEATSLFGRPLLGGVEATERGLTRIANARVPGTSFYPVPALRSLFDYRTWGIAQPDVQRAAIQVGTPALEAAEQASRRSEAELRYLAEPLLTEGGTREEALRLRGLAEGRPENLGLGDPLQPLAERLALEDRARLLRQWEAGVATKDRPGHIARSIDVEASRLQGRSSPFGLPGTSVLQAARKKALDLPGQTPVVEELIGDPRISGASSTITNPRERSAYVLRRLLQEQQAGLTDEVIPGIVSAANQRTLKALARKVDPTLSPAQLADPEFLRRHLGGYTPEAPVAVPRPVEPAAPQAIQPPVPAPEPPALADLPVDAPVPVPGLLNPENLRQALGQLTPLQQLQLFGKRSPLNVLRLQSNRFQKYAKGLSDVFAQEGAPFFTPDVFADFRRAEGIANTQNAAAQTAVAAITQTHPVTGLPLARPVSELQQAGQRFTTVNQALRKAFGDKARDVTEAILDEAGKTIGYHHEGVYQQVAERLGIDTSALSRKQLGEQFDRLAVPRDVGEALKGLRQSFQVPREIRPFSDLLGQLNALFRGTVYPIFPGSHVRNAATALVNNLRSGAVYPEGGLVERVFGPIRDANRLLRGEPSLRALPLPYQEAGRSAEESLQAYLIDAYSRGIALRPQTLQEGLSPGRTADRLFALPPGVPHQGAPLEGTTWNPLDIAGFGGRETSAFRPVALGNLVGSRVEDVARISQDLALQARGYSPEAAAKLVEATHFDYARLAPFERFLKSTLVPFYTFTRRNLPRQLQLLADRPSQIATPIRALTAMRGESFVPGYLGGGAVIPLGGENEDGRQRYISTLGLPEEEAFERFRQDPLTGVVGGTAQAYLGLLTPYARSPLELLTGRQLYSGRQLSDLRPYGLATGYGLLAQNDPRAQLLAQTISTLPISRLVTTVDKLIDARKGLLAKAVNLGTGVRVTDVDVDTARAIEVRRLLESALQSSPNVATMTEFYVPPGQQANVDPRTALLLRAFARSRSDARAAAEARRSGR